MNLTRIAELRVADSISLAERLALLDIAEEALSLREQLAFVERFADAPDMKTGKTTRDELREQLAGAHEAIDALEILVAAVQDERDDLKAQLAGANALGMIRIQELQTELATARASAGAPQPVVSEEAVKAARLWLDNGETTDDDISSFANEFLRLAGKE